MLTIKHCITSDAHCCVARTSAECNYKKVNKTRKIWKTFTVHSKANTISEQNNMTHRAKA